MLLAAHGLSENYSLHQNIGTVWLLLLLLFSSPSLCVVALALLIVLRC